MNEHQKTTISLKNILGLLVLLIVLSITIPFFMEIKNTYSSLSSDCSFEQCANLIVVESSAMLSAAFSEAQKAHQIAAATGSKDLTPYMRFISVETTQTSANTPNTWYQLIRIVLRSNNNTYTGELLQPCSQRLPCIMLHNGSILQYDTQQTFGRTDATNAILFNLDPDGPGPQGYVSFYQYSDGQLTTGEYKTPGTKMIPSTLTVQDKDPTYVKW